MLSGTLAKTIRVNTGDVSSGFLVQKVQVVVDWRAISSTDPTNPGRGATSLFDKYFTITSPQGVTRTLVAANTYQGEGTSHRVVMTFDDDANQSPSFTAESGRFTPNQSLSVYSGTNPIGNWTLTMGSNSMFAGVTLYGFNVILLKPECGDGFPNKAEQCDDGNTTG